MKKSTLITSLVITIGAVATQVSVLWHWWHFLPPLVPLWYTLPWGEAQLVNPSALVIIPLLTLLLGGINSGAIWWLAKSKSNLAKESGNVSQAIFGLTTIIAVAFTTSLLAIIRRVALSQEPLIKLDLVSLAGPLIVSFILATFFAPLVIRFAKRIGAVDDPLTHKHPAILHTKPTPRAGALAFYLAFLVAGLLFLPLTKITVGIYVAAGFTTLVGVIDDKFDLSPYLRLMGLLPIAAAMVLIAGVSLRAFANPLGGVIRVDLLSIPLGSHFISLPADIISFLWIIWVMNMLSWSNGVDGQFGGIVGFSSLTLAILALRPSLGETISPEVATLAALTAGAAFGLTLNTWHPAKMFWGFGATTPALLIATLSILSGAKAATALLVMIVPLADALTAIIRRVRQGQSPVWGDREHLHHKLLNRGWSHAQVALFYWVATALCGLVTIFTAENTKVLSLLIIGGVVAFVTTLTIFKPLPEKKNKG